MDVQSWKRFENSGKIEDYLAFVSGVKQEQVKEGSHAGTYMCNGNRIETDSYRGVRQAYQPFD